jgi:putative aminopeptidase FrvX
VFTRNGEAQRGALLLTKASVHVYGIKVKQLEREDENMEVRLDARTQSAAETRALGVEVGDFVAFDPRLEVVNGFVRSRHLDDKACVACILAAVKALHDAGLKPAHTSHILISNYEEVGHGAAAGIPPEATELLTVDMAAVGEGQTSDEFHAAVCEKFGGPYHHGFSQRLRQLAKRTASLIRWISTDYGSDGEAFWRRRRCGRSADWTGVDASHNYERTTWRRWWAQRWVVAYL